MKIINKITNILICFSLFSNILFAKDMPISNKLKITIPYKSFVAFEFPFEIKDKDITPFVYVKKKVKSKKVKKNYDEYKKPSLNKTTNNDTLNLPKTPTKIQKKIIQKQKVKKIPPLSITVGKNIIKIYARELGHTELIIWGYKAYPIMLELEVVQNDKYANKYIKFLDYKTNENKAEIFESTYHERVLTKLIYALYNNKTPTGYKLKEDTKVFQLDFFKLVLIKELVGKRYIASEYLVANNSDKTLNLYEEMFSADGVYAISFENNNLNKHSNTRMFVVTRR